jgi:hypothetical protein
MQMAIFDQRGQKVNYQFNAAGDINFNGVHDKVELITELRKLLAEVLQATKAGVLTGEVAIDVESNIKKAVFQSEKSKPDKQSILENINGAKTLIEGVASAAGLVNGFVEAIEMIRRVY